MGTWSESVFGNDDAADFLFDIEDAASRAEVIPVLEGALDSVICADGYIEAPDGAVGLAAAALAVSWERPGSLDEETAEQVGGPWPRTSEALPRELVAKAAAVLERMLSSEENELAGLWTEAGQRARFNAEISRWRVLLG